MKGSYGLKTHNCEDEDDQSVEAVEDDNDFAEDCEDFTEDGVRTLLKKMVKTLLKKMVASLLKMVTTRLMM